MRISPGNQNHQVSFYGRDKRAQSRRAGKFGGKTVGAEASTPQDGVGSRNGAERVREGKQREISAVGRTMSAAVPLVSQGWARGRLSV